MKITRVREPIIADDCGLANSSFVNVDLQGTVMSDVNLSGVVITNANCKGLSLRNAALEGMTIDAILVSDLFAAYRKA